MRDPQLIALLKTVPLYADLDEDELADMALGTRRLDFRPGDALVRQGGRADGIYLILSGMVKVTTRLPGGGQTLIAEGGPGTTLGELATIRSSPRTATVTATDPVEVIYVDWRFLSAALAQFRPGGFKVMRRLAVVLARRLRHLHDQIRVAGTGGGKPYEMLRLLPPPGDAAAEGEEPAAFNVGAFLPMLPGFRAFDTAGIQAMRAKSINRCVRRGRPVVVAGHDPGQVYVVVRGAVATGFLGAGGIHLVTVRGPGCFGAVSALIENRSASADHVACEDTVLLELPRKPFFAMWLRADPLALALVTAVTQHQAAMIARATNHLTRLVGLSRLFGQLDRGTDRPP